MPDAVAMDPAAEAGAAARRAGVRIEAVTRPEQAEAVNALLCTVWDVPAGGTIVESNTLIALAHSGNYLVAAYLGTQMVGATLAWFGAEQGRPPGRTMHSHIAGVLPEHAGTGIGVAMKLDQRAWGLDRGVELVTWTYDPLVARNAHLNLGRLGATVLTYAVNRYGLMRDGINAGQESDRLLVGWPLARPVGGPAAADLPPGRLLLAVGDDGRPVVSGALTDDPDVVRLAVPRDIERLHRGDPLAHAGWRQALRHTLGTLLDSGWQVVGFDGPAAHYVLRRSS